MYTLSQVLDWMGRTRSKRGREELRTEVLVGNRGVERPLGKPRRRCEDNKWIFKK
jgi:hypothetical protein